MRKNMFVFWNNNQTIFLPAGAPGSDSRLYCLDLKELRNQCFNVFTKLKPYFIFFVQQKKTLIHLSCLLSWSRLIGRLFQNESNIIYWNADWGTF